MPGPGVPPWQPRGEEGGAQCALPGEEGDGNADEDETKESNHSGPGNDPREDVPVDLLCQEGEGFVEDLTLINANGVARKLKLLVSLHALGGKPRCGESLCQQHPSQMDGGTTGPCGAEDTTVTLGSNSGEASGDCHSSHVTRRASALASTEAIGPGGPQGSTLEEHPYKCLQCRQSFKKSSNLLGHRETHSRAKPNACELCSKVYLHKGTLQQHRCLHTGERPYTCPFRARNYTRSSDYRKHIHTHTGERPYGCADCGNAFARSSDSASTSATRTAMTSPSPALTAGAPSTSPSPCSTISGDT